MADAYQFAQQFRAALLQRDAQAAARLIAAYELGASRLEANLRQLLASVEAARARGETITDGWLHRQARFRELIQQANQEMLRLAAFSDGLITEQQRAEIERGLRDSATLMESAAGEIGINPSFAQAPKAAVENLVGALGDGSPLRGVLGRYGIEGAAVIERELIAGLVAGEPIAKVARRMRGAVGGNLDKALQIARSETLRAYRNASLKNGQANAEYLSGWEWVASKSARTCLACTALDGQFFPLEKPQPAHVNCIPAGAMIHAPTVKGSTSRWYEGEIVELATVGGYRLSVTPNHPILTAKGWIAAGLLNEGDEIVCTSVPDRMLSAINPNENHIPARIEEVARAFAESVSVFSVSMPTAAEDFHGDGEGSQVHVVNVNGLLREGFDSSRFQSFTEQQFIGGNARNVSLVSDGAFDLLFDGMLPASRGFVCSRCVSLALFGRARGNQHLISFGIPPMLNAHALKPQPDNMASNPEGFSQGVLGFSGNVPPHNFSIGQDMPMSAFRLNASLAQEADNSRIFDAEVSRESAARLASLVHFDQVGKISKRDFSGQVYNLQTVTGWYIANGIITHNCRCTSIFRIKGEPPRQRETAAEWFAKQPDSVKRQSMTADELEAFNAGRVSLRDFVGRTDSEKWGSSYHQLSLKRALAGEGKFPENQRPNVEPAKPTKPAELQPAGIPIERGLKLPSKGPVANAGRNALAAIARVHGDGELPEIPVEREPSVKRFGGYHYYLTGKPLKITVRPGAAAHPEMTLAHEIGHFLDHQGAGKGKHASVTSDDFAEFRKAAQESKAIQEIERLIKVRKVAVKLGGGEEIEYPVDGKYLRYLTDTKEVWARAYAQYIALRSGDSEMQSQLKQLRQRLGQVYYPSQWDDDDFAPIAGAIDRLMLKLGWRK